MSIEIRHLTKRFGSFAALSDINLTVRPGELLALLGPSGSGKTTLLRMIAGLETTDSLDDGEILFEGINVADKPVGERGIGFVFQHYALFRHMTVYDNIAFGLRVRPRQLRPSKGEISKQVSELLKLIQLEGIQHRFPWQLSGGQRQRVALARALAVRPKILLLDEPFGALDARVRADLRQWLRRLHDELHVTSVLVTHDQEEALEVADRIVVINQGRIQQVGSPEEVFHHPASEFVMAFLGNVNLFHGRVQGEKAVFGPHPIDSADPESGSPELVRLLVRPHEIEILPPGDENSPIAARVTRVQRAGSQVRVELEQENGSPVLVEMSHDAYQAMPVAKGQVVALRPRKTRIFNDNGAGI